MRNTRNRLGPLVARWFNWNVCDNSFFTWNMRQYWNLGRRPRRCWHSYDPYLVGCTERGRERVVRHGWCDVCVWTVKTTNWKNLACNFITCVNACNYLWKLNSSSAFIVMRHTWFTFGSFFCFRFCFFCTRVPSRAPIPLQPNRLAPKKFLSTLDEFITKHNTATVNSATQLTVVVHKNLLICVLFFRFFPGFL